ncbi:hypothetical protein BDN72DRAFT_864706 [Pluteus cervinus]|uniref:Uncharacterized protein n=1 Tax=Pluteus cervinus TaxID=181527 RepID=A0ACD3A2W5_9AGAR|nr:hypothetical protein BDN72DRAFT_864706 [Pluteus cervinus]
MSERPSTRSAADALREAKAVMATFSDLPTSPPTLLRLRVEQLELAAALLAPFAEMPQILKAEADFDPIAQSVITGANAMADLISGLKRTPNLDACNQIIKFLDDSRIIKPKDTIPEGNATTTEVPEAEKKDEPMQVNAEGPVPEVKNAPPAPKAMEGVPTGPRYPGSGSKSKNIVIHDMRIPKRKGPVDVEPAPGPKRPRGRHEYRRDNAISREVL